MLSKFSYPIICTGDFVHTVAFYEDYFEYVPVLEMENFVILQRKEWSDMYLAIIDSNHQAIPARYRKPVRGMILSFPVHSAQKAFLELYMEGLNVLSEPEPALCGRSHFFVEDPNGILIDVAEEIDIEGLTDPEVIKELCIVV